MAAKEFGVTEFINPKDHKKPIQEVGYVNSFLYPCWFLLMNFFSFSSFPCILSEGNANVIIGDSGGNRWGCGL
jgi:hypothetical protein